MLSIVDFKGEAFERVAAWARYLYWADIHRQRFDEYSKGANIEDDESCSEFLGLICAWYASLWVVIEGWKTVPLSDASVDDLLLAAPRYQTLLRRLRNGVFHYQPKLLNQRLIEFLRESDGSLLWAHLLHHEFCRFYWQLIEEAPIPKESFSELRETMVGIVGWTPEHIPEAHVASVRRQADAAITMLRESGDLANPNAQDLLRASVNCGDVAFVADQRFQALKAWMIGRIKEKA